MKTLQALAILAFLLGGRTFYGCDNNTILRAPATVTPIPIANPSFEDPVVGCDGCNTGGATGWDIATAYNPTNTNYPGAAGNGTPSGADGAQVDVLSGGVGHHKQFLRGNDGILNTDDDPVVTGLTKYTFTVAIGHLADVPFSGYSIELDAWDPNTGTYTPLGVQTDAMTPAAGQFADATLTVDTTSINPNLIGQRFVIWLSNTNPNFSYTNFDNVRLTAVSRVTAVSRKMHAGVPYDISMPGGIECRSGGANNDYQLVLSFDHTVNVGSTTIASGTGSISNVSGNGTATVTVSLTGVTNAQTVTVNFSNVNDGTSTFSFPVQLRVLVGDTTGDGTVNSADIGLTKSKSGQAIDATNFRNDLNADGTLNSGDIGLVKSRSGTALP